MPCQKAKSAWLAPRNKAEYDGLLARSLVEAGSAERMNIEMPSDVVGASINHLCEQFETFIQEVAEIWS